MQMLLDDRPSYDILLCRERIAEKEYLLGLCSWQERCEAIDRAWDEFMGRSA